ncbi:pantoate--beta-alanine ligase [bacterium]|nr:pantoate--beta-alanine ligase [bacterium]
MQTIHTVSQMQSLSKDWKREGHRIGFVPTMGALHEGHLSLVDLVRPECERLVVSVFVNPTQFGPNEDLEKYPRNLERDLSLLAKRKVDVVFAPEKEEIYAKEHATYIEVEGLSSVYEGAVRPGHFRGVCTVVAMLFNIVMPDVAAFGQKDAQQAAVLRHLTKDLHFPIRFLVGQTIRENDGLAMSSRNAYLTADERPKATVLYRALKAGEARILGGESDGNSVREAMGNMLNDIPEFKPDYFDIVHPESFEKVNEICGDVLLIIAGKIGSVRLIDNLPVQQKT